MEQTLSFIIASLGICLNCHVRTKEITIEAILFEYSRTSFANEILIGSHHNRASSDVEYMSAH